MKKYSCNCTKNQTGQSCHQCRDRSETTTAPGDANLYAAEFFLYAFHFEEAPRRAESKALLFNSLMILAVEG